MRGDDLDPERAEDERQDERRCRQSEDTAGSPTPVLSFRQCEQHRDQPAGEERGAEEIYAGGRLDRRLRHEPLHQDGGDSDRDRPDDEEPAPGDVVHDQPRQDDPEPASDAEYRRDEPDRHAQLLAGELVPDDPEAEGEDRAAGALDRARDDQRPDVPGAGGGDRADQEDRQADHEQAFLAVLVAELAEERGRDGCDEQKDREHPGDPGRRGVQIPLQCR